MTDLPFTDNDLRTEAARQHQTATEDPDFVGIAEQMDGQFIDSTIVDPDPETGSEPPTGRTWDSLGPDEFGKAHRAIDDILGRAADVSDWAINLGADGLEPLGESISLDAGGSPLCRIHLAVRPDMSDEMRRDLIEGLGAEIAKYL